MKSNILVASFLSAVIGTSLLGELALAQTPRAGGSVVFAIGSDPAGFNRNISTSNADGLVACIVYEGLIDVDPSGKIVPRLAKSWTIAPDGLTYDFQLNAANWHDGKPFTSADVKYTLLEVSSKFSAVFAGAAKVIDAIETPASDRVRIKLKQAYGPFLLSLGCAQGGAILPEHLFKDTDVAKNPATTTTPVGTGAFTLAEWRKGAFIRLKKNPNYWDKGLPYLDEVVGQILPQAAARTQAMMSNNVDFVSFTLLPSNDYRLVTQTGKFRLIPSPIPSIDVMLTNITRKSLSDPRVRQALLMATDRKFLLNSAYNGVGTEGTMPFSNRFTWAADPETDYSKLYPFDVAKANALLDAAGVAKAANGIRLALTLNYLSDDQDAPLVATALKTMWRAIGVDLTIVPGERAAMLPKIFDKRDFDLALVAYASNGDPALGFARMFVSSSAGLNFGNPTGYSNPEIDKLFDDGQLASSMEARGEAYKKIQRILGKDLPILTLHERIANSGMATKLKGLDDEYYLPTFRGAWWEQ